MLAAIKRRQSQRQGWTDWIDGMIGRTARFVSLGAGNCETEVGIVEYLRARASAPFVFQCLDLNPHMLERGRKLAVEKGVEPMMRCVSADVRSWRVRNGKFDVVIANQSLHHFVELEELFEKVALATAGVLLRPTIIGRNGHMRWPEALTIIHDLWREMPARYRYNRLHDRIEPLYENWDYSTEGFEGIRAQDILPPLLKYFRFQLFLGFGNLIDIFVDRAFGHNFDPEKAEDRAFIDRVAALDDQLIEEGLLKPTHVFAVMQTNLVPAPRYYKHLTPESCVRTPISDP
jgi:SAM-dependent methyltransferase